MNKLIFLFSLSLILSVVKSNTVPIHEWTVLTGTAANDEGEALVNHKLDGTMYVTGSTEGQLGMIPNAGGKDIFLIKYDENGTIIWKRTYGTSGDEVGTGLAIDYNDDSVYIAGYTNGNLDGNTNAGGFDAVLIKVSDTGNKLWTKLVGSALDDKAFGVAVKPKGLTKHVYITGYASGAIAGQTFSGSKDILLAKYNPAGIQQFVNLCGTASEEEAYAISISDETSESIYVTGYTKGNLGLNANSGQADIFIRKYDNTGSHIVFNNYIIGGHLWTKLYGGAFNDIAHSMHLDLATEDIYITGYHGSIDGLPYYGDWDIILAKYSSAGIQQWVQVAGTSEADKGYGIVGMPSNSDAIYICGITGGDLNGALNNQTLNGTQTKDVFLMKYSSAGEYLWTDLFGTFPEDSGVSVGVTADGIFVTGFTQDPLHGQPYNGLKDIFLVKYTEENAPSCIKPGNTKDCGFCGLMTCLDTNYWSECENEGVCEAHTTKVCRNICKSKICNDDCLWGICLIVECDGGNHCTGCTCDAEYKPTVPPSEDCVSISSESSSSSVSMSVGTSSSSSVASSSSLSVGSSSSVASSSSVQSSSVGSSSSIAGSSSGSVGSSSSIASSSSDSVGSSSSIASSSSDSIGSSSLSLSDAGKICPTRTISWILFCVGSFLFI